MRMRWGASHIEVTLCTCKPSPALWTACLPLCVPCCCSCLRDPAPAAFTFPTASCLQDLFYLVLFRLGHLARTPWALASSPMTVISFFYLHPQRTTAPGSALLRLITVDAAGALAVCSLDFTWRRAFLAARMRSIVDPPATPSAEAPPGGSRRSVSNSATLTRRHAVPA